MKIKEFTIADLKQAISLNNLWDTEVIPITKHRAISHVNNPRADENDIALIVAYENGDVIGYLGVLPEKIFIEEIEYKVGFLSCWWINPAFGSLGATFLLIALQRYEDHIFSFDFTHSAAKVYEASNRFIKLKEIEGLRMNIRINSKDIISEKIPKLRILRPVLGIIDYFMNRFINLRLMIWERNNNDILKNIKIEYVNNIDRETQAFIKKNRKRELFKRGSKELNWIIKYPWVLSAPLNDKTSAGYYFSSVSNRFLFLNIKIFNANDVMIGFLILQLRDNRLIIPYCYFDEYSIDYILKVIGLHIIKLNVYTFSTFNQDLIENLSKIKFPVFYTGNISRLCITSKKYKDIDFKNYHLQDGDGDRVFT